MVPPGDKIDLIALDVEKKLFANGKV